MTPDRRIVEGSSDDHDACADCDSAQRDANDVRRFVHETPGIGGGYPHVRNSRTPVRCIVLTHRSTNDFERTAARYS